MPDTPQQLTPGPISVGGYIVGTYGPVQDPEAFPVEGIDNGQLVIDLGWCRAAGLKVKVLGDHAVDHNRVKLDR